MMMNLRDKSDASGGKTYLFAMVFNLAVQIVFSLALSAIMIYGGYSSAEEVPYYPTINLLAMMALQGAFLAAILFVRPRLLPLPEKKASAWAADIAFAVAAAALCLACFSWLGEWFALLLDAVGYKLSSLTIDGVTDIILAVVVTVVLAPVIEETIFRNALIGDLCKSRGMWATVALSGLFFALMHMSPQQTVYQFFLGAVCAYVFIKTGNIACPILIHAVNNAVAIVLSLVNVPLLQPAEGSISVLTNNIAVSIPVTIILAVAGAAAIYFLGKPYKTAFEFGGMTKDGEKKQRDIGFIARIVALVICGCMWIFNFIGSI